MIIGVKTGENTVIAGCETGGAYASEIERLREVLSRVGRLEKVSFIADGGYDAVDLIERFKEFGCKSAIRMKETFRMKIRNSLRKYGMEDWMVYGRERYRAEALFWMIKRMVGCGLGFVRDEMARRAVLAVAVLWNLHMLIVFLFLSVCLLRSKTCT